MGAAMGVLFQEPHGYEDSGDKRTSGLKTCNCSKSMTEGHWRRREQVLLETIYWSVEKTCKGEQKLRGGIIAFDPKYLHLTI